jgi:hypothetical protein
MALLLHAVKAFRPAGPDPGEMPDAAPQVLRDKGDDFASSLLTEDESRQLIATNFPGEKKRGYVFRIGIIGGRLSQDHRIRKRLTLRRAVQGRRFPSAEVNAEMSWYADDELERIALADDAMLVVYDVPSALNVESVVRRSGSDAWGFILFFQGYDQLRYVLDLVPSLTGRFAVPVLAAGETQPEDEIRIMELIDEHGQAGRHFNGVVLLDDGSLDQALRTVLLAMAASPA